MLTDPIHILLADDNKDICDSLEANIRIEAEKYLLSEDDIIIHKAFTEHAYDHGCVAVKNGLKPNICVFDLVFNGKTGIDLYRWINNHLPGLKINLCIYTGVEKRFDKREEAEMLASATSGAIQIIAKPDIGKLLEWFDGVLESEYHLEKQIDETDPFDLL